MKKIAFLRICTGVLLFGLSGTGHGLADEGHGHNKVKKKLEQMSTVGGGLMELKMDSQRGKTLFVDKGCIACHAINGVGGEGAPDLSAHPDHAFANPFDLAARMWNHSQGMVAVQLAAFDEQILLTGQEFADMTAFIHDDDLQHKFSEADLTAKAHKMMEHSHGDEEHGDDGGEHAQPAKDNSH